MRFALAAVVGLTLVTFLTTFMSKTAPSDHQAVLLLWIAVGIACVTGGTAIAVAARLLALRYRRVLLLVPLLGIVMAGYCLLFIRVAFHERARTWEMVRCSVRLMEVREAVIRYHRTHQRLPQSVNDLDLAEDRRVCSITGQPYILWPNGMPDSLPLPPGTVIAREAESGHLTHWFGPVAPVKVADNPEHPSLLEYPTEHRQERRSDARFYCGVPCTGPLEITMWGVHIPGGGSGPMDLGSPR